MSRLNRALPRNPEAEKAVLGSILHGGGVINRVAMVLEPDDFALEENKEIYSACLYLASKNEEVDLLTVKDQLKKAGQLSFVGGASYVSSLIDEIPSIANVEKYAGLIKEASQQKRIILTYQEALEQVGKIPSAELVAATSEKLYSLIVSDGDDARPTSVSSIVSDVMKEIDERRVTKNFLTGITTGLPTLDAYLLGWQRGVLTVLGAYTSHGKTASGLDFALKALETPGNEQLNVLYVALEMTKKMLGFRLLANASGEKLHWVRTGNLSDAGLGRVGAGGARLAAVGKRFLVTDGAFGMNQIAAIARSLKHQGKLDLMFVDYLQLVEGGDEDTREREVAEVGKGLLRIAKSLDIATIAFAQLNDGVANRDGHEPKIQDMRESRAINQHARTVILLNRPWMFDKANESLSPCLTFLYIEKNSESKSGKLQLHFNAAYQRFEEGECRPGCEYFKGEGLPKWQQ